MGKSPQKHEKLINTCEMQITEEGAKMFIEISKSFLTIALELSVLFISVSFIINLLQGFIPFEKLEKYFFNNRPILGGFIAILFAFITPFCSCSTIPIVVNMLNKKMRFGIVMVFLFASPVLDPTILTLMAVILGWRVAVVYILVTSIMALIIGFALEAFGFENAVKNVAMTGFQEKSKRINVKEAWKETLALIRTVYPYLILGAFIGSIIHGVVPTEWVAQNFGGDQWWLIPVAAILGIPLYIRLSTMVPISQILIVKGMALGPVMAMMISSSGASLPELTLLHSIFKKKLIIAFVISVFVMASMSGIIFNLI